MRPRTSKGITAKSNHRHKVQFNLSTCADQLLTGLLLILPVTTPVRPFERRTLSSFGLPGLIKRARLPAGLARTLSRKVYSTAHPFACVATARRYPSSPQDRPRGRSLYQVVLPAAESRQTGTPSARQLGGFPHGG